MRRRTFFVTGTFVLLAASYGCAGHHEEEAKLDADHQTAGLTGEITNGKVDVTMEGSGNLAWQGSFEREKRAKMQSAKPQ